MDTLLPFAVCLVLITVAAVRYHLPPFLTLVGASILFGALSGMPAGVFMPAITGGAGRLFGILGIVIFSGAVIAQVLRESRLIEIIVADITRVAGRPLHTSGLAGFLLSVPLMCNITSFVILSPIVAHLRSGGSGVRQLLYVLAVGGSLSFVLLYPSPVMHSILSTLNFYPGDPWRIDVVTLPIALALLAALLLASRRRLPPPEEGDTAPPAEAPAQERLRAWAPFAVLLLVLAAGAALPAFDLLGDINIALLAALIAALAGVTGEVRLRALAKGTKNAGIIIFDLSGAGAFGAVIAASAFPSEVYALALPVMPEILLPFVVAALVQAAQGSRVVTAAVTSTILGASGAVSALNPAATALMICAGAFSFSYVSDPFFWLIKRTTGDGFSSVVRHYTLPLFIAGMVTLAAALLVQAVLG
ncbi:MAG: hypothetical protein PHV57_02265 [Methanomicrobiaceae archaeon]|nr:hypothetical protein [Methanomicrobiaceae archaeon]